MSAQVKDPTDAEYKFIKHYAEDCDNQKAEIYFVIDGSWSIHDDDFLKQIYFIQELVQVFKIGPKFVRVGALTYANGAVEQFKLNQHTSQNDLRGAISKITRPKNGDMTLTNDALEFVRMIGIGKLGLTRPGVVQIIIVFTDGKSHYSDETKKQANKLKDDGVILFAIGIGPNIDIDELNTIGSKPIDEHVFYVADYPALESIKSVLSTKACSDISKGNKKTMN